MANPKHRTSHSRKGTRRAHDALTAPTLVVCRHCGSRTRPHHVCPKCGYYHARKWTRPVISVDVE